MDRSLKNVEYGIVEVTIDKGCELDGKDEDAGISWLPGENVLEHGLGGAERPVLSVTIKGCEISKEYVDDDVVERILPEVSGRGSFDAILEVYVSEFPVACFFVCCKLALSGPRLSDVFSLSFLQFSTNTLSSSVNKSANLFIFLIISSLLFSIFFVSSRKRITDTRISRLFKHYEFVSISFKLSTEWSKVSHVTVPHL